MNNRLEETRYADGSSEQFSYDVMGNRTEAVQIDAQGNRRVTRWEYDVRDRLVKETQADGTLLEYQYDANGNRTQVKLTQAGKVVVTDYTYDELNRLSTVTDASGMTRYAYDEVGNRTSVSYPNHTSQVYAYDSLNRLRLLGHYNAQNVLTQRYSYTLDASGHRTQIAELNNRVSDYSYDLLYRLTQEHITDPVKGDYLASYQYDNVGNRVYSTVNGVGTSYSYDDNDRLTQQGSTSYSYDNNGNTLSKNAAGQFTQYTYNDQDKLVTVQQGVDNLTYQYNVNGIRTQKTQNGSTTKYLVDENRDYAQVLVEENPLQRVVYSYGDDLISQNRNGALAFYHYDGLGSTRRLSNAAGVLTDAYDYEAFGTTLNKVGSTENAYLFTGEQLDGALNQYYLRARYYDQGSGRFTQMDTYQGNNSDPVSLHKYLYANGNPVNYTDPSGNTTMGQLLTGINIAGNIQTVGTIGVNILTGNYTVAAGQIAEEVVYAKLGALGRPVGHLSKSALNLFYRIYSRGKTFKFRTPTKETAALDLAHNLKEVGVTRPSDTAAHHIIPWKEEKASDARNILEGYGIHINSAINGVFLPTSKSSSALGSMHRGRHTSDYIDEINMRIKSADLRGGKIAVLNELGSIKMQLLSGELMLGKI